MSKWCWLAVIFLPVILLSLEADAQPTVDETMTCSSSTLEEITNVVRMAASDQIKNAVEIKDEIKNEIADVKKLLASNPNAAKCHQKQALMSALECESRYIRQVNGVELADILFYLCFRPSIPRSVRTQYLDANISKTV